MVESISIGLSAFVPIDIEVAESKVRAPLASTSKVVDWTVIGASELVPIPIEVGESILSAPEEDTDNVPCPSNVVFPVISISKNVPADADM